MSPNPNIFKFMADVKVRVSGEFSAAGSLRSGHEIRTDKQPVNDK